MSGNFCKRIKSLSIFSALPIVLLLILWLATAAWAREEEGEPAPAGEAVATDIQATNDDGGPWELGIHGTAGDLPTATAAERAGMRYWLEPANNWVVRYSYAESSAWEKDFKRAALGGWENDYIDAVDLQFYVGHGWPGGFTFANATQSDGSIVPNDCSRSWGDGDNEWLALTSCQVLADSNLSQWANCMNGQHLIMGFVTNASAYNNASSTQAYHFGRYIMQNYTMPQAWYKACDVAQRGRVTRTIINELACLNDKPNTGSVCADSLDTDWWYQTHSCGTETAIYVPAEDIQALPVYRMKAYSLEEAKADFENLGSIFGIPVTETLSAAAVDQSGPMFFVSTSTVNSRTLEMDRYSGIFNYSDLDELWTSKQALQAMSVSAASSNFISSDDAKQIADNFLRDKKLNAEGAVFYEVIADTISNRIDTADPTMAASLDKVEQLPLLYQVIYSRRIISPLITAAGVSQGVEFSVVGPGAKQKVYVPVAAPVGAASVLDTVPVGVQGGWREIEPMVNAATGEAVQVTILTVDQVKALYMALPEDVSLNSIPLDIESRTILSETIAYWEEATGVSQGELIPVYELKVKMTERQSKEIFEEYVYVPASELYMRPLARIISAPTEIKAGQAISLTAADASKTLKSLHIADFDLVLGSGDYIYEWYLNGEKIGSGRTLSNFVVPFDDDGRDTTLQFELRVTDIQSPNESFSTAKIASPQRLFLPTVIR
jgi:hypothetical protein